MRFARLAALVALALALLAVPVGAEAQPPAGKVWRIGALTSLYSPDSEQLQAFRERLRALSYVEGRNIVIEARFAQGRDDRLPGLAAELVRLKVDVIVADNSLATRAAMQATSTIPIVMTGSADPEGTGLVSNLRRPGGNVTGLSIMLAELATKRLQLLKDAVPSVSRVAILWDPGIAWYGAM